MFNVDNNISVGDFGCYGRPIPLGAKMLNEEHFFHKNRLNRYSPLIVRFDAGN